MHLAVIRVSGVDFDPDGFAKQHGLAPDISWRAGQPDLVGLRHPHSGFNLTVADEPTVNQSLAKLRQWIQHNKLALQTLESWGGTAVLDVALSVSASDQNPSSVAFSESDLALFVESNLTLCITGDPSQED
jgi:hypothetical protein